MQAIEFVQMQRDDDLWDLLISLALADAELLGTLPIHLYIDECIFESEHT